MAEKKQKIVVSGQRKRAIARASISKGTGKILIDKAPYELLPEIRRLMIQEPLEITKNVLGKIDFDISVITNGGGIESRIEAARLAIARAFIAITKSKDLKKAFLSYDRNLLIADVRRKEPCKPGDSKARKKRQKSYR